MIASNKIRGLCAEKGITQAELAKRIGMSPKTLYAKLKKGIFGSDELEIIANIFKVDVNSLFLSQN